MLVVDKTTDHDNPHFDLIFTTISTSKNYFFAERELKKAFTAQLIDASSEVWTLIYNGKLPNHIERLAAWIVKRLVLSMSATILVKIPVKYR